jgi:tetratricopeptide (TPR) repeat protein
MIPNLRMLINSLRFDDQDLLDLRNRILESLGKTDKLKNILENQIQSRGQVNCFSCENEGICSALIGIIHFDLGEMKAAIKALEDANQHFRSKDETWNSVIGLEILGMAYEGNGNRHQAILEYKQALGILTRQYLPIHANEYETDGASLKKELECIIDTPLIPVKKAVHNTPASTSFLIPVLMPIFTGVQAHPDGPIWDEPSAKTNQSYIDKIILEDKPYSIHSLTNSNVITLTSDKNYGWAKVSGTSMSASRPEPILDNSFVLFYKAAEADDNGIVIASRREANRSGYEYVIKRYDKRGKMLLSETNPPNLFDPISINKDVHILGVVIAVAKPL